MANYPPGVPNLPRGHGGRPGRPGRPALAVQPWPSRPPSPHSSDKCPPWPCWPCQVPPGRGCCCVHRHHHGDSSAASSEEDAVGSGDARIQRCVRTSAPNLLVEGTYAHLAKVDACAARGMDAIAAGTPPPVAADVVAACVDGESFPDSVLPFVADFKDCVKRGLT
ncbi:uncharacterized protein LOC117653859 [Thrips palmi]|uniref:Uncharacterized protein LOC117653859 n=1 Tax=Thrips palmi TaxID=161013 RepID=A0A6P9AC21_THRPL|nr:uncharacterized protein LOC117653859 [Thrips palmi]